MLRSYSLFLFLSIALPLSAGEISFTRQIAPLLIEQCVECHREGKVKGGYRLDTWRELQRAGDSEAPPLVSGQPEQSEFYRLIVTHDEDDRMPKKADPLSPDQVKLIHDWIAAGARFDGGEKAADQPLAALVPEAEGGQAPERYPHPLPVTALAPHPNGERLAVAGYHEVTLWQVETRELVRRLGGLPERVLTLEWLVRKEGEPWLLAAGGVPGRSGGLWLVESEAKDKPPRRLLQTRDCLMCLALSPDGQRAVVAGADNAVRCVELSSGKLLWSVEAHADWVLDLAMSPDGRHVATASRDRTARLLSLKDGEIEATFTAHPAPVTSVLFRGDGQIVYSGGADGEIRTWNLEGQGVKDSTLRPGRVEVAAMANAGDLLLAAMADGRLVPLRTKERKALEPLVRAADRLESLIVVPEAGGGWRVFAGGHDGTVHRLILPPTKLEKPTEKEASPKPVEVKPAPPLHFVASPGWSPP